MNNPIARELLESPPTGPCVFELYRFRDAKGIASKYADQPDGKVMEGFITSKGKVMMQWLSHFSSTITFDSWEAFVYVHIHPHTENETMIKFYSMAVADQPTRIWPAARHDDEDDDDRMVERVIELALGVGSA